MARAQADAPGAEGGGSVQGWGSASVRAMGMLAVAFVVFAVLPVWLLDRFAPRLTTTGRDLVLVACWLAGFVLCAWLFVRLQRGGR